MSYLASPRPAYEGQGASSPPAGRPGAGPGRGGARANESDGNAGAELAPAAVGDSKPPHEIAGEADADTLTGTLGDRFFLL
ncbi:MAG TPA: hypothetical protein VFS43_29645 [Polyangiaceae bacterium]|nr:hypothetical protein [Polyangiaceae bacterium]